MTRLNNDQLVDEALRYRALGAEVRKITEERDGVQDAIVAELRQRRRTDFTHRGIKVSIVTKRLYDVAALGERIGARLLGRVTRRVVDGKALAVEIKAGRIDEADIEACSHPSDPWIRVSGEEREAA